MSLAPSSQPQAAAPLAPSTATHLYVPATSVHSEVICPAGHFVHSEEPSSLTYSPTAQKAHSWLPEPLAARPGGQVSHVVDCALEAAVPAEQFGQTSAPRPSTAEPGRHARQTFTSSSGPNWPGWHGTQLAEVVSRKFPRSQTWVDESLTTLSCGVSCWDRQDPSRPSCTATLAVRMCCPGASGAPTAPTPSRSLARKERARSAGEDQGGVWQRLPI